MNSVKDTSLTNKSVFLRCDMNVPMKDGLIIDNTRIVASIETIKYLMKVGSKIIICSHLGRPEGQKNLKYSLKPVHSELEKLLDTKINFISDVTSDEEIKNCQISPFGSIHLLENIRFYPEEEAGDENFAFKLSQYANVFVNDAFACSHRKHSSIYHISKFLPSLAGIKLQEEVENIEKILNNESKIFSIVGGSKVSTKIQLLKSLIDRSSHVALGGGMANTFFMALKYDIGASMYESDFVDTASEILEYAKNANCKIILPSDVITSKSINHSIDSRVLDINLPLEYDEIIVDIGPESQKQIHTEIMQNAKTILWNGPLGVYENKPFDCGSMSLARSIAKATQLGSTSVVGGGDAVACAQISGMSNQMSFISTAGGAFLEYIENNGLEALSLLTKKIEF